MATRMMAAEEVRFLAPDGTQWKVYEIADAHTQWATRSLIFVSDRGFRRVHRYPANWRDLDADALHDLSWSR